MPPNPIISRESIIQAGFEIAKDKGFESLNARCIAVKLGCSTKPLFRVYSNMEELKSDIKIEIEKYYNQFMSAFITENHMLLSTSIGYTEFARQERNLFERMFVSNTIAGKSIADIINAEWNRRTIDQTSEHYGITIQKAEEVFRDMWLYSHGIAAELYANDMNFPAVEVEKLLTRAINCFINTSDMEL